MNVQELIQFMAIQSISDDVPDDTEKRTYLIWLNIAYREIYRMLVSVNQAWAAKTVEMDVANGVALQQLPTDFFRQLVMQDLGQCGFILPMRTLSWIIAAQQGNQSYGLGNNNGNPFGILNGDGSCGCGGTGNLSCACSCECGNPCGPASYWYVKDFNQVNLWPQPITTRIKLTYIPNVLPLELNTQENEIMVPLMYQEVIAYGALINLYKSEANLRSAMDIQDTVRQYKAGKTALLSYFARNYDNFFRSVIQDF